MSGYCDCERSCMLTAAERYHARVTCRYRDGKVRPVPEPREAWPWRGHPEDFAERVARDTDLNPGQVDECIAAVTALGYVLVPADSPAPVPSERERG